MSTPVHAIRALRWNYRWRGVWIYLRARNVILWRAGIKGRGWWLVLRYPSFVVAHQLALAEGVTT